MRQLNKKLRKEIQRFNLEELIEKIMYNSFSKDSKNRREPFENWFDKKSKSICLLMHIAGSSIRAVVFSSVEL